MHDDAAAARESGFGTGLLAHLERGRVPELGPEPEPPAPPNAEPVRPEPELVAPPRPEPDPRAELQRMLVERDAALEAARAELVLREAQLAGSREASDGEASLPDHLRARAESAAERVWLAFGDALEATHLDGRPDHAMRIAAAQALLAELRLDPPGAAFADELARRRERREASR